MASLYTLSVIAAWYFSNIGVILLNKYLLSVYGFRYPIFLTMMHMVRAYAIPGGSEEIMLDLSIKQLKKLADERKSKM